MTGLVELTKAERLELSICHRVDATRDAHRTDLEVVETLYDRGSTLRRLERCRQCGQQYRYESDEVNDWTSYGDRYDETELWWPLTDADAAAFRADVNHEPAGLVFKYETGWIST